jgi:hypothetical protein
MTGNLTVPGGLVINGDINVKGKSTLNSDLNVNGNSTLNKDVSITGKTTLNSDLNVNGNSTLNKDVSITGKTIMNDNLQLGNTIINNDILYDLMNTQMGIIFSNGDTKVTVKFDKPFKKQPYVFLTLVDIEGITWNGWTVGFGWQDTDPNKITNLGFDLYINRPNMKSDVFGIGTYSHVRWLWIAISKNNDISQILQ